MSLRSAFSFSLVESLGSRILDLITLWIVLNNLPEGDIANFGLATSALFFFNLVFFVPETALLRFQKEWEKSGRIGEFLFSFLAFSLSKILLHFLMLIVAAVYYGPASWITYAVLFSAITQQIQMSEIVRIHMRMNLQQSLVAKVELAMRVGLTLSCLSVMQFPRLDVYFSIYFTWALLSSFYWWSHLLRDLKIVPAIRVLQNLVDSMKGFSLWSQMTGNLTFYLYNSGVFFLASTSAGTEEVALYTVVVRTMNLFFVIPMMIQAFVPILLSQPSGNQTATFNRILSANAVLSLVQFLGFIAFGRHIGMLFGLEDAQLVEEYYIVGLIISGGSLILNTVRPLSTWLLIRRSPARVTLTAFAPAALLATVLYPVGAWTLGPLGCAIASAIVYIALSMMFVLLRRLLPAPESE
jgi:hypothetical protein